MNPEELKQKIAYYYSKLPKQVQEMFSSMSWLETLKRISTQHGLNALQIETLGTETTLVLLGIINLEEYERNLSKELGLSKENLDSLLIEVNGLVLDPIRTELTKAYEANLASEGAGEENKKLAAENTPADYAEALLKISRDHALSVAQMGVIENLIKGIVGGTGDAMKFEEALEKNAWMNREKAHAVTLDINEKVFKVIKKDIMEKGEEEAHRALQSAGIDIIPQKPKVEFQTNFAGADREEMIKSIENPPITTPSLIAKEPLPIHQQKLAGHFQIPKTETHYEEKAGGGPAGDPYREPI